MDDLAVAGDDDDSFGTDFDDRCDVLVGLVLGDCDPFAEQVDASVRADETDDFYSAFGW